MGKFLEETWKKYCEENHTSDAKYIVAVTRGTVEQLTTELSEDKISQIMEAIDKFITIYTNLEKKAFVDGIHRGCNIMIDNL